MTDHLLHNLHSTRYQNCSRNWNNTTSNWTI